MQRIRRIVVRALAAALAASLLASGTSSATAQEPVPDQPSAPPPAAPMGVSGTLSNGLVLRGDSSETTLMTIVSGAYAWNDSFATFARLGSVINASKGLPGASGLANGAVGVSLELEVTKHLTLGGQSGFTIPFGSGGGDTASPGAVRAWLNLVDWDTMYAVNHVDVFNGVRVSYELEPLTIAFESVFHELLRVRGANTDPIGAAASITGTTASLSYAVLRQLSLSTALSETRVWNTPTYVRDDPNYRVDYFLSGAVSTEFKLYGVELRPTFLYARALDLPLSAQGFQVAEVDVAFSL